jgi:hypothetical protein
MAFRRITQGGKHMYVVVEAWAPNQEFLSLPAAARAMAAHLALASMEES